LEEIWLPLQKRQEPTARITAGLPKSAGHCPKVALSQAPENRHKQKGFPQTQPGATQEDTAEAGERTRERVTMDYEPISPVALALQATRIGFEAQSVIAMRLAGMAGLWATPPSEFALMVAEKAQAALEAAEAAVVAALRGQGPDAMLEASMVEIGRHTSGNLERLSRMGPAWGPVFW